MSAPGRMLEEANGGQDTAMTLAAESKALGRPLASDIDVFGLTHPGKVRRVNQDQFLIASLHKLLRVHQSSLPPEDITTLISESRGWILLVADGVGGRPDGQAATGATDLSTPETVQLVAVAVPPDLPSRG